MNSSKAILHFIKIWENLFLLNYFNTVISFILVPNSIILNYVLMNNLIPSNTIYVDYNKSRETFDADFSVAGHIYGTENPSYILTKPVN